MGRYRRKYKVIFLNESKYCKNMLRMYKKEKDKGGDDNFAWTISLSSIAEAISPRPVYCNLANLLRNGIEGATLIQDRNSLREKTEPNNVYVLLNDGLQIAEAYPDRFVRRKEFMSYVQSAEAERICSQIEREYYLSD
ncbi:MAG: hypothetical protein ABH824_05375 [Nanoarchaeota archaeon]|nr:hypothetical protein [Nanoarchaeota archaeon]MBU1631908.1 hypothetical protein [Nanoarchaeota archaeon]MBU1876605.1 hypothetical protein [Nanoarchaeota archaeon]